MAFTLRTPEDMPIAGAPPPAPQPMPPSAPAADYTPDYSSIGESPIPTQLPLDENKQRRLNYAQWLKDNQDKAGTPDYVRMAEAYRTVSDAAEQPKTPELVNSLLRVATKGGPIGALDYMGALGNAGLNPLEPPSVRELRAKVEAAGGKMYPEVGSIIRDTMGVPHDAPTAGQGLAENIASLVLPAGATIAKAVANAPGAAQKLGTLIGSTFRNVVAPGVGSEALGTVGGAVGGAVGGPEGAEKGALIGSGVGGVGGQSVAGVPGGIWSRIKQRYDPAQYAGKTAPQVAQYGVNQSVTPTFGALANQRGVALERQLAPNSPTIEAHNQTMLSDMQNRARDLVQLRQALPDVTPQNASIVNMAERTRNAGGDASQAVQQHLQAAVGSQSPVDVTATIGALNDLKKRMDIGDWNATVAPRLKNLQDMQMQGMNGPLPLVTYEQFKNWRSNLGRQLVDMPAMQSHYHGEAYEPATTAMRNAAIAANVPGEAFDAAQQITKSQDRAQQLAELFRTTLHAEKAGGPRQFANQIEALKANDPAALKDLGGKNAIDLEQLAELARRGDYASVKGGGAKILASAPSRFGPGAIAYGLTHAATGGTLLPMAAGVATAKYLPSIEGKLVESDWARKRLAGGPRIAQPPQPMLTPPNSFDRILQAMSAANVGSQ